MNQKPLCQRYSGPCRRSVPAVAAGWNCASARTRFELVTPINAAIERERLMVVQYCRTIHGRPRPSNRSRPRPRPRPRLRSRCHERPRGERCIARHIIASQRGTAEQCEDEDDDENENDASFSEWMHSTPSSLPGGITACKQTQSSVPSCSLAWGRGLG
jgi:hypothetical protein